VVARLEVAAELARRGTLRLWEAATGRLVAQRRLTGGVVPAFSPTSDQVYINVIEDSSLLVLDRATLKPARASIGFGTPSTASCRIPTTGRCSPIAQDGAVLRVVPDTGDVAPVELPCSDPAQMRWAYPLVRGLQTSGKLLRGDPLTPLQLRRTIV
jgi:hypothetical protein